MVDSDNRQPTLNRRRVLAGLGTGGLAVLAGCSGNANNQGNSGDGGANNDTMSSGGDSDSGKLKLGVLVPFSGEYAWVGANVYPVAKLIAKEINNTGGINGKSVGLVKGDTQASPTAALTTAKKLVNVNGVEGIIGPTSLTVSAVIDFFQTNEVPMVSPTAGTTALDDVGGEYLFRTVPSDALGGRAIAKGARYKKYNTIKSYKQMGLMVGKAEALQSFKEPIRSSFKEYGGTITKTVNFKTGKPSYRSDVQTMLQSDPPLITLVASPEDSVKIMQAAYQAGYEGNWFLTQDQTNVDFLKQMPEKVTNNSLGLQEAVYSEAKEVGRIDQFRQRYKQAYEGTPGLFAKNTFDAMNVMGLAMKAIATTSAKLTGPNIAKHIPMVANPPQKKVTTYTEGAKVLSNGSKTSLNYQGLVGPVNFDKGGDITAPFAILKASGDKWNQVAVIPPEKLME
jgi:ABC-type branched-subunit amino acid transport system substrate-binding protein